MQKQNETKQNKNSEKTIFNKWVKYGIGAVVTIGAAYAAYKFVTKGE